MTWPGQASRGFGYKIYIEGDRIETTLMRVEIHSFRWILVFKIYIKRGLDGPLFANHDPVVKHVDLTGSH